MQKTKRIKYTHFFYMKNLKTKLNSVRDRQDLIDLLNIILQESVLPRTEKKITIRQFKYFLSRLSGKNMKYSIDKRPIISDCYRTFELKKRSGGTRQINAPSVELKLILKCIDVLVRNISEPHHCATGFIESKSIVDNASAHLGKNYVYNIDLKDFFHSFDLNKIKMGFYREPFGLSGEREPLAFDLACLVTYIIDDRRVLPQGSPASPAITNYLCIRLDRRLNGLAKRFGASYTRYADDISFSSNVNVYRGEFQKELKRLVDSEGFIINEKKTRLLTKSQRQEVTGVTVNSKLNVSRTYIKWIRRYLYLLERYGQDKAIDLYTKDYIKGKGEDLLDHPPSLELVLKGKLNYLSMVKGKDDSTYLSLQRRYENLFKPISFIQKLIDLWKEEGIDAVRKFYYNKRQYKTTKDDLALIDVLNLANDGLGISFDPKYSDEQLQKSRPIEAITWKMKADFFNHVFGFQFESEIEFKKYYNEHVKGQEESYYNHFCRDEQVKLFIESSNANKHLLKPFLLDYFSHLLDLVNLPKFGESEKMVTKEALLEAFNEYQLKKNDDEE